MSRRTGRLALDLAPGIGAGYWRPIGNEKRRPARAVIGSKNADERVVPRSAVVGEGRDLVASGGIPLVPRAVKREDYVIGS